MYNPIKATASGRSAKQQVSTGGTKGLNLLTASEFLDDKQLLACENYFVEQEGKLIKRKGLRETFTVAGGYSPSMIKAWTDTIWVYAYNKTVAVYNATTGVHTVVKDDFTTADPFTGARYGDFFFVCNGGDKIGRIALSGYGYTELTDAPKAKVLAIIGTRLYAGNLSGTIVGGGSGDVSTVVWAEQDTGGATPFTNWTTTATPPEMDDPASLRFRNAKEVKAILPDIDGKITVLFDSGETGFTSEALNVDGVGIAQDTKTAYERISYGSEIGAISTPFGIFYVNESGLWTLGYGESKQISQVLGEEFIDDIDFTDADLVYDDVKQNIYVTCRNQGSSFNNLVIYYNLSNKSFGTITGWKIRRFMKIGKTIYGTDSLTTSVWELFYGSNDNGNPIGTEWKKEFRGGSIDNLYALMETKVKGFISNGSSIRIHFDIYTKNGDYIKDFAQYGLSYGGIVAITEGFNDLGFNDGGFENSAITTNLIETRCSRRTRIREFSRLIVRITSNDVYPHEINWIYLMFMDKGFNRKNNYLTKL